MKQYLTTENILGVSAIANIILLIAAIYFQRMYKHYKSRSEQLTETLFSNLQSYKLSKKPIENERTTSKSSKYCFKRLQMQE
jgi:hypothetical protein